MMSGEELFRDFWWLIFPIFGLIMAAWSMASSETRNKRVMDLIKSYVDQGKDPPAELLKMVSEDAPYSTPHLPDARRTNTGWSFVTFAALAAGFTVGWWFVQGESFAFAFLIVAVTMGVLALGSLVMLLINRK